MTALTILMYQRPCCHVKSLVKTRYFNVINVINLTSKDVHLYDFIVPLAQYLHIPDATRTRK